MKIVYYTQSFFLDSDFPLLQEYQRQEHEVMIFITLAPYSLRGTLFDIKKQIERDDVLKACEYTELGVYNNYLNLDNVYIVNRTTNTVKTVAYYKSMKKMCRMIKTFNPDVVHTTMPLDTMDVLLLQFRKKLVVTIHDPFLHSGKDGMRSNFFRYITIKCTPKIVLLNTTQKESFKKAYDVHENRILINSLGIYNFISSFKIPNISHANFNVLFFGHISSYKGLEYLCQAMIDVHKKHPEATLTIDGSGKVYFDYSPYEDMSYIELRNRYIGMEELATLLERCSVVVCPYKDATQSGVIMTAFAKNRPIVASNVGALGEQIADGITGVLIPPCDVASLSKALVNLADNPSFVKEMGNNIEKRNHDSGNSWMAIANKYIDFYKKKL